MPPWPHISHTQQAAVATAPAVLTHASKGSLRAAAGGRGNQQAPRNKASSAMGRLASSTHCQGINSTTQPPARGDTAGASKPMAMIAMVTLGRSWAEYSLVDASAWPRGMNGKRAKPCSPRKVTALPSAPTRRSAVWHLRKTPMNPATPGARPRAAPAIGWVAFQHQPKQIGRILTQASVATSMQCFTYFPVKPRR